MKNSSGIEMYRGMVRCRLFEERVGELFVRGGTAGSMLHLSIGEEGPAVGVGFAMKPGDMFTTHHRGHSIFMARGADPNRMMLYGYSYGGFAAAAAAARSGGASAGLWQCAISGAPAIDLERIKNDWGEDRLQRATQGNTVAGWDPMEHLQDVKIPWLIFHGDYDRQADTIHSRTAAARMRQVNPSANFRYVEIPRMSHQLVQMTPEHKAQFLNLILDWTSNNCGNISAQFKEPGLATTPSRRASR